jgi:hypothetical protein
MLSTDICVWPAARSCSTGPPPREGMCVTNAPACVLDSPVDRCPVEPMPGVPRDSLPTACRGLSYSADTASQGKRWNSPSSTMRRALPVPSSAGWETRFGVPPMRCVCARSPAAASSVAVWLSRPQACILPSCRLSQGTPAASVMGRASMSARMQMLPLPPPWRSWPASPVPPGPQCTSQPQAARGGQALGHEVACGVLLKPVPGVDGPADAGRSSPAARPRFARAGSSCAWRSASVAVAQRQAGLSQSSRGKMPGMQRRLTHP